MKKMLTVGLLLLLMLGIGMAAASAETTLMVYMCGTDLQDAACDDIIEMAEAYANDVNILVLAGGANEWDLDGLEGRTRNFAVIRDGEFEELEDWGRGSMGEAESLAEFLEYGLTEYPADRTIVVLWDHGAGSEGGVCFDETANDDGLTVAEINNVLTEVRKNVPDFHINIFGCDACMMATYEMAAVLSHYPIDYYVASEELEPGCGWYYKGWLEALRDDPDMSDETLCGHIIETFMEASLAETPDDYLTLSAVDLRQIGPLETSMEAFATVMTDQIQGGNLASVRRGRSRMYTMGSFDDASWDMVDLGAVLDTYAQYDPAGAAEAKKSLGKAVILSNQTDNLAACCGLSILMPQDTAESFDEYKDGFDVSDVIPNWVGFVNGYVSLLQEEQGYHFTAGDMTQIHGGWEYDEDEYFIYSWASPDGWLDWDDEDECYAEEPTQADGVMISDSDQGFTAVLSQDDLQYLDYVEGMLLMDISEEGSEGYIDFGTMQNNLVDWKTGKVVSLYDGMWPVFGDQPVPLYDQSSNENSRRSLLPVKLNGEYTYLVVVFPTGSTEGRIIGANAGYDDNGMPIRNVTKLKNGDVIVPVYTLYVEEEGKEDLQESEYLGMEIIWQDGMTVTYEDLSDDDDPVDMLFCFIFNDIFGEYTMSEMMAFQL